MHAVGIALLVVGSGLIVFGVAMFGWLLWENWQERKLWREMRAKDIARWRAIWDEDDGG